MWLMPCSSSSSSVRSASACVTVPSAAAPKIVRVLSWPVLPNGAFLDHSPTLTVPTPHDVIRSATRLGATFAAYRVAGSSGDGYSTEECDARCGA